MTKSKKGARIKQVLQTNRFKIGNGKTGLSFTRKKTIRKKG